MGSHAITGKFFFEASDGHWSRAVLPFQLSNIFENDTHHGIATFLFNETDTSSIFFQIVVETKAFLVPDNFLAWGWLEGRVESLGLNECDLARKAYPEEKRDRLPMKSLNIWHSKATEDLMRDIEQGFGGKTSIVNGLVKDEVIYATPCRAARGDYPYPPVDEVRYLVCDQDGFLYHCIPASCTSDERRSTEL